MDTRTRLAARVADIAPFHVMEVQTAARALEAAGRNVVHMEIGEPDFPTPGPVLDAARAALDHGGIYYTSALGLPALRAAIARHYGERYGVDVSPERVIVTAGSSAALLLVSALVVNRDDQILMADPGYPCNRHFVRTLEGEPVAVPVGFTTFPGEIWRTPRSWVERAYPNVDIYYNEVDKGGHFAAWEEPELFATEVRAAFRSLR